MARGIRVEFAGGISHVVEQGDRREDIYLDDESRRSFLGTLAETCGMTWACVGVDDLCIETPEANLVAGIQWLQKRCSPGRACKPCFTPPKWGLRA